MKKKLITTGKKFFGIGVLVILHSMTWAQSPIKLNYRNFLVPPDVIYSYQNANGGVAVPSSGTNQVWDYSGLMNSPGTVSDPFIPESNPAFSTCRRQQISSENLGAGFFPVIYNHQKDNTSLFSVIGLSAGRAAYSLKNITGNSNDSLIMLAQNIFYGGNNLTIPYPLTYSSNWLCNYNYEISAQISLAAQGLNHASLKYKTHVDFTHAVTGWGTMRIPTVYGPSDYIPCLLLKIIRTRVDSFFVNSSPANAAVLSVLNFSQGQTAYQYLYRFKRTGIEQDLATFYFTNSSFSTVDRVIYDRTHYDLYCISNNICHAKLCVDGINQCFAYNNNDANNALLNLHGSLGICEDLRIADNEAEENDGITISPNPSNNQFSIKLKTAAETIHVYDLSGRVVEQFENVIGDLSFGNQLVHGIYFAEIITGTDKKVMRIIKSE